MKAKIALTGGTGNMGQQTLLQLANSQAVQSIKVLVLPSEKRKGRAIQRRFGKKVSVLYGDLADFDTATRLVKDCHYVLNLAAVIPPLSDENPALAEQCNDIGTKNLTNAIENLAENQPKLVHISTVAVYGNRNSKHMWAQVGDPLMPSVFDVYALSKLRGEFFVMQSKIKHWVVLRQTAMLYDKMLTNNISDGLMFHTCFNAPLEWSTARDSGVLMRKIVEKDMGFEVSEAEKTDGTTNKTPADSKTAENCPNCSSNTVATQIGGKLGDKTAANCPNCSSNTVAIQIGGKLGDKSAANCPNCSSNTVATQIGGKLGDKFWGKCFNIGGGSGGRVTGYDTFDYGFKLIGGSTKKFMSPAWNATRNFHGVWFLDSDKLDDMFDYTTDTFAGFWQHIKKTHRHYALAKLLPPSLISKFAIKRLLKHKNSPHFWNKSNNKAMIFAYFGDENGYVKLPKNFADFPLLVEGFDEQGNAIDYQKLLDISHATPLCHGFDQTKPDNDLNIDDMKKAAEFRGGKLISQKMTIGDMTTPLIWQCSDGHQFSATPYSILRAGHWCIECFEGNKWNYDALSKKSQFFAQVWYDSHKKDEDVLYFCDKNYHQNYKKLNTQ